MSENHGRPGTYRSGCRCDECRAANTARARVYHAKMRLRTEPSDPAKARAGKAGMRARWGEQPRLVRIDHLDMEKRALIVELVEALEQGRRPVVQLASLTEPQRQLVEALIAAGRSA